MNGSCDKSTPVIRFKKQYQGAHAIYYEGNVNIQKK